MVESTSDEKEMETSGQNKNNEGGIPYKVKAGAFLAFAGGFGLLAGFGGALAQVKKQDPGAYDMGSGKPVEGEEQTRKLAQQMAKMSEEQRAELVRARKAVALQETGAALASRALAWGTFYAVGGCGILFFSIWKMMGVQNMTEFRQKVGRALPSVPRSPPKPGERTEFSGINDFLHYIIERDEVERREKRKQQQSNIEKPP